VGLSMAERRAVTKQMARRYARASKKDKGRMLDELCALTGWTRRHARRALHQAGQGTGPRPRRARERFYGPEVIAPLRRVWATLDGPAGKRLAPFMAEIVQTLERAGELTLEPAVRAKLLAMSAATIDRVPSQLSWTLSGVNRLGFGLQVGPAWRFEAQELVQLHVVVAQGPAQVVDLAGEIPLT
jgi:hypothetical protein